MWLLVFFGIIHSNIAEGSERKSVPDFQRFDSVRYEAHTTLLGEIFMEKEIKLMPYEQAKKIVAEIVDEEHLTEPNLRIFTVYADKGESICWFDAEEMLKEAGVKKLEDAYDFILHQIPDWRD
jgi:hypothetical protein